MNRRLVPAEKYSPCAAILLGIGSSKGAGVDSIGGASVLRRQLERGTVFKPYATEAALKLRVPPCPSQNADPGSWLRLPKRSGNQGIDSDAARSHVPRSARASFPGTSKSNG